MASASGTSANGATALNGKLVTVFGGSGFIGRHVVRALARRGYRVRVAVRRPDLAEHVQPLGAVGQIMPVQANLRHRWSVDRAVGRQANPVPRPETEDKAAPSPGDEMSAADLHS